MDNYVVQLNCVSKSLKEINVIHDVDLKLENSKIYGIVGRNGSGKSVLLKLMAGLMIPTSGTVKIYGEELKMGHYAKDTGILLDCTGFLPEYSAHENLRILADIRKVVSEKEIDEILRLVGLDPYSKLAYRKYSLGMKQKLSIAQAFMENPKLLLLDEPMNALDKDSVSDMRRYFRNYVKNTGATIVLTSHNSEDIKIMCDEVFQVEDGRLSICK